MTDIRKCPFCGESVEIIFYKSANYGRVYHKKYNQMLNRYEMIMDSKCILKNAELVAHSSSELIDKWNGVA